MGQHCEILLKFQGALFPEFIVMKSAIKLACAKNSIKKLKKSEITKKEPLVVARFFRKFSQTKHEPPRVMIATTS